MGKNDTGSLPDIVLFFTCTIALGMTQCTFDNNIDICPLQYNSTPHPSYHFEFCNEEYDIVRYTIKI